MPNPTRLHPTTTASFVDHLDLFIGDLSGEAVDRHVHPVTLFAFRHAFEICSGGINTELCWIHIQTTDRTYSPVWPSLAAANAAAHYLSAELSFSYSRTSSSWVPSTVPSSRSSAIWSQYRFSPSTMNFAGLLRSGVPGAYFPVCAITSIIRFQVRA